jgi:hypothetical protein
MMKGICRGIRAGGAAGAALLASRALPAALGGGESCESMTTALTSAHAPHQPQVWPSFCFSSQVWSGAK